MTSIADTLATIVATRESQIQASVDSTLKAFEADLRDGKVTWAEDGSIEHKVLKWTPPAGWETAHKKVIEVLATTTKMEVSWNGCLQCQVELRPRIVNAPALSAEKVASGLRAIRQLVLGDEASAADLEAASILVKAWTYPGAAFGGNIRDPLCFVADENPCPHQVPHANQYRRVPACTRGF